MSWRDLLERALRGPGSLAAEGQLGGGTIPKPQNPYAKDAKGWLPQASAPVEQHEAHAAQETTCATPHQASADQQPSSQVFAWATSVLNQAGIRIMQIDGIITLGIWTDLDGQGIREALQALGMGGYPVVGLEKAGIPHRYKIRQVSECGQAVPWPEWRAASLNQLFQEQGTSGKPGMITAASVQHGERSSQAGSDRGGPMASGMVGTDRWPRSTATTTAE